MSRNTITKIKLGSCKIKILDDISASEGTKKKLEDSEK